MHVYYDVTKYYGQPIPPKCIYIKSLIGEIMSFPQRFKVTFKLITPKCQSVILIVKSYTIQGECQESILEEVKKANKAMSQKSASLDEKNRQLFLEKVSLTKF